MKRSALIIVAIFVCMSMQPVIATSVAPNDAETVSNSVNVLSVDGFVTTKFASVGSDVDIQAYTRGHSSNTYVSADIVKYDIDPLDSMISTAFPGTGAFVDRVVLTSVGVHENDANTKQLTWLFLRNEVINRMDKTWTLEKDFEKVAQRTQEQGHSASMFNIVMKPTGIGRTLNPGVETDPS